jgi:TctA family transporter
MIDAAFEAFSHLFVWSYLFHVVGGVLLGLFFGLVPGLGGMTALALLLPFTFTMDALNAFALMVGLLSVVATADTIPAVLFGIPGTVAAQATIVDGHPMAKNGEAGRALGAAFTASLIGGLIGAFILGVSIPVFRPIILAFGSPEFFMLGILGLSMVAVISGASPMKGLIAGCLGLLFGMVGMDPQLGVLRWTSDILFIFDGLNIIPVTLGLFAIPEILDAGMRRSAIAANNDSDVRGVLSGIRDSLRNWFLILRGSILGVFIGVIPGLGQSVADWFVYGHALQTEKGARETFGKGDVRGVIAPECCNNAVTAGSLIPTIVFGIPGSAAMAIFLGALTIQGIAPGTAMLTAHLDITYTIVWTIAVANLFGAFLCLLLARQLSNISRIPASFLLPLIMGIVFIASYAASFNIREIIVLFAFGILGWCMKYLKWPRPPLMLGFVLSGIIEQNLFTSISRYGLTWLGHPLVLVIGAFAFASIIYGFWPHLKRLTFGSGIKFRLKFSADALFSLLLLALLLVVFSQALQFHAQARLFPIVILVPAIIFCTFELLRELLIGWQRDSRSDSGMDLALSAGIKPERIRQYLLSYGLWMAGTILAIALFGLIVVLPIYIFLALRYEAKVSWRHSALSGGMFLAFLFIVFDRVMGIIWYKPWLPELQEYLLGSLRWLVG